LGQAGSGRGGDFLHGVEVDIGTGPGLAEGACGNNSAPTGSQVVDILELFRGNFATCHG
jgi:hypothetical protein